MVLPTTDVRAQEGVLERFLPKPPTAGKYDWIRLKSGEWLKGRIRVMRKEVLEFDSDELDDLHLDWEDIVEVRSPGPTTFVFEGRQVVIGSGAIDTHNVVINLIVKKGDEPRQEIYERKDLMAIIRGAFSERKRWRGKASIGATIRAGNTNQTDFFATANIVREQSFSRLTLDYMGEVSTANDVPLVDNHRANFSLDIYVSRRLYITPAALEIRSDQFQNIDLRIIPSAGIGYDIIDMPKFEWNVELRPGYRWTRSVGDGNTTNEGIITSKTGFEWDVTKRTDFEGFYQAQIGIPNTEATDHHAQLKFSVEITRYVDLDVTFDWDHIGQPIDTGGGVPVPNDYRLGIGIGLDF
jgi:putative salt-induced outer membrane protein YdiY